MTSWVCDDKRMRNFPALHLYTPLSKNVTLLFQKLETRLNLNMSVEALVAGGVACVFTLEIVLHAIWTPCFLPVF